jgi:hypothetical protein
VLTLEQLLPSQKDENRTIPFAGNFHHSDIGTNTAPGYPYPRYLLPSLASNQSTVASIEQVTYYNCSRLIHSVTFVVCLNRLPLCRYCILRCSIFFTARTTWSLPSHATSVRQPRRCFFSPWTALLRYLGLVFSWSSALHGIEPTTGCEPRHSQRHLLSRIWQLRKMPLPLVTG